jgi:hypothetical protein
MGQCSYLSNMRETVHSICCRLGALRAVNAGDTPPATVVGKCASRLHQMLASPMPGAYVKHRPTAYFEHVWPRADIGPLPEWGASLVLRGDTAPSSSL